VAPAPIADTTQPQLDDEEDQAEAFESVDSADSPEEMLGGMDETCEAETEASFKALASTNTSHYFVNVDPTDPEADDVGGLDREGTVGPHSVTQFLTLPTIAARATSRIRDPIVDFSKSIMLIADSYLAIVEYLQVQRDGAAREKERKWIEREESK
jgi:hypothetical protein